MKRFLVLVFFVIVLIPGCWCCRNCSDGSCKVTEKETELEPAYQERRSGPMQMDFGK